MSKFVVDTFAWIEYFDGSEKGLQVKDVIENPVNEIITNILTVSEIASVLGRRDESDERPFEQILMHSKIFTIDVDFAREVGRLHADVRKKVKDFGLVGAFVLATARKLNAKVVTGDPHFKGFKEAILL